MTAPLSTEPLTKAHASVNGKRMAYHEVGSGDPTLFRHRERYEL